MISSIMVKRKLGNPLGLISKKKMTLPLIHVLNQSSKSEKRFIINTIKTEIKTKLKLKVNPVC